MKGFQYIGRLSLNPKFESDEVMFRTKEWRRRLSQNESLFIKFCILNNFV